MENSKVPMLRFPGFKGEWEEKKLGELSQLITKGTTPQKFVKEGIKFIKIESFEGDRINPSKCLFIDLTTHEKELKRSRLDEGDILFAIAGATIGKVNIVLSEILPANTNQALAIVRLNPISNRNFILQVLKSEIMKRYIQDNIAVGAQPNLNLEQMNNFSFAVPTLPEQTKIASFLQAIDTRLQALRQKKNLLEQYKQGLMQKLFSQKIRFKDENGEDFGEWEEKTLKDLARITTGSSNRVDSNLDGEYTFFDRSQDIRSSNIYLFDSEAVIVGGEGKEFVPKYFKGKFVFIYRLLV